MSSTELITGLYLYMSTTISEEIEKNVKDLSHLQIVLFRLYRELINRPKTSDTVRNINVIEIF